MVDVMCSFLVTLCIYVGLINSDNKITLEGHPDALDTAEYVSSRVASSSISTAFVGIVATTLPSLAG